MVKKRFPSVINTENDTNGASEEGNNMSFIEETHTDVNFSLNKHPFTGERVTVKRELDDFDTRETHTEIKHVKRELDDFDNRETANEVHGYLDLRSTIKSEKVDSVDSPDFIRHEELHIKSDDDAEQSPDNRKIGVKGKAIGSQGREIINNVIRFMQQEAETAVTIPIAQYRKRALAATGISRATYQKIATEGRKQLYSPSAKFSSPRKKRQRKMPVFDKVTPRLIEEIKTIINDFYIIEKRRPTLGCIYQKIQDKQLGFHGKVTSLNKLLKRMGFRWKKTTDNKKALIEKYDIRLKRIEFLKQIIKYRAENRYIVYTDATYIPISKGQRLIIVHAGGERGFIPNALLIFKSSGSNSGDYHEDLNPINFMKWVETQLIPNLPERSVLVIDNASYHNVTVERNITSTSLKVDMMRWLGDHGLQFEENWTKAEMYKKTQENKFRFPPKYKLDALMEQHNHSVLRLPSYHPELNPIENIWALVKNGVAARNVTSRISDVHQLTINKFEEVRVDEWKKICDHVKKYEDTQIEKEHLLDNAMDSLRIIVNIGSSSEEETNLDITSDIETSETE